MEKKFLDILMVYPSGGSIYISNFRHNLGSAYILAYLQEKKFKAEQFLSKDSYNIKECVQKIIRYRPKVVGFTVYDTNYMQCVLISNGLKTSNSNIIIIFGGPTATVNSKEILESNKNVDLCVKCEGEETVHELLLTLSKNNYELVKTDLDKIKGITFRKGGKIIMNPERNALLSKKLIKNCLDEYPSPYLSNVIPPSEAYHVGIITTRGCNQNCVYCNCSILSKRNIFFHSIERVIEELIYLNDNIQYKRPIPINDDSFTLIPTRAKRICEAIIENNLKIPLFCITRCDKINEELLDLMKQAGFVSVGFSLESAVPRVLRNIGKVTAPESIPSENFDKEIAFIEKLKQMTSYAKKIGIEIVYVNIMVGLPGETIQDAEKTIDVVKRLDIDFYTHNNFHIFRGTPIYENHKKYGYKIKPAGQNNKIFIKNNYPFDVYKIKLAPKSATERNSRVIDYQNLKILSMDTKRTVQKPFFDNVIINSNIIKQSLVKWIQVNLAINGTIIQTYSNKFEYDKHKKKNLTTLNNHFLPTMYYESYYWENINDTKILKSGRMTYLGENIGMPIILKNTHSTMEEYKEGDISMENLISTDNTLIDTKALYSLLVRLSKSDNSFQYLMKSKPLPQFQNLCRWTNNQANCRTLETAIIGNDDSIRICWHSDPVGKVGTSFSEIIHYLKQQDKIEREKRKCDECVKSKNCVKCFFPFPLSSEKFCEYIKASDTTFPAKLINSLNLVKDFIYKPITLLDF